MQPMINGTARVVRGEHVAAHELGGSEGGVLLHLRSGQYHGVDGVGWVIWNLLDGTRTFDEVVQQLRRLYPDAPERLPDETRTFIQDLVDRDLAAVVPSGGSA